MSYDIKLVDRETKKPYKIDKQIVDSGVIEVKEYNGILIPNEEVDAYINITYNYADWYYLAFDRGERYYNSIRDMSYVPDYADTDREGRGYGIRSIYGMTGERSIVELDYVIEKLEDGKWHPEFDITEDDLVEDYIDRVNEWNSLPEEEKRYLADMKIVPTKYELDDYYTSTRSNALKPLYQLKRLAEMIPEGIWMGD